MKSLEINYNAESEIDFTRIGNSKVKRRRNLITICNHQIKENDEFPQTSGHRNAFLRSFISGNCDHYPFDFMNHESSTKNRSSKLCLKAIINSFF